MLEEELVDLFTLCLQAPDSADAAAQKLRITEIGREIHSDGGLDAMVNFFFAVRNRVLGETKLDPAALSSLWDAIDPKWAEESKNIPDESDAPTAE